MSKTDQPIKAIETRYAGCRFRSRTEARCAVAFDALGEPWRYELDGYYLNSPRDDERTFRYLPDFWLPERRLWVEVKGSEEQLGRDWDLLLHAALPRGGLPADPDGTPVAQSGTVPRLLVLGPTPSPQPNLGVRSGFLLFEVLDGRIVICRTDLLGNKTKILFDLQDSGDICLPARCFDLDGFNIEMVRVNEQERNDESRRINYALTCARSARFEHGEKPDVVPWRAGEPQPW